jgi:hypothetical protein
MARRLIPARASSELGSVAAKAALKSASALSLGAASLGLDQQGNFARSPARSSKLSPAPLPKSVAAAQPTKVSPIGRSEVCTMPNKSNRKVIDDEGVSFA